jgi:hypothetical protein
MWREFHVNLVFKEIAGNAGVSGVARCGRNFNI